MRKRRVLVVAIILGLAGLFLLPVGLAVADCSITSVSGSDDTVVCSPPTEQTTAVFTGSGNDTITVQSGAVIRTTSGDAIHAGAGSDTVWNYGSIYSAGAGVHLSTGTDVLHNYGLVSSNDDGAWCVLETGHVCTINNYAGATISSVNEAVDFYGRAGRAVVNNQGTITASREEGIHLFGEASYGINNLRVVNSGHIESPRLALEASYTQVTIENSGTMTVRRGEPTIRVGGQDDTIINTGTISQTGRDVVIVLSWGRDVLHNYGTIIANNDEAIDSAIDMGGSNDTYRHGGTLQEQGAGYAAVLMGYGSDTVVIEGGLIQGMIDGDAREGANAADRDRLVFELTGSDEEVAAFEAAMASQSPAGGSVVWRGNTFNWRNFEEFQFTLTRTGPGPAPTPVPTSTPSPAPTAVPTGQPTPPSGGIVHQQTVTGNSVNSASVSSASIAAQAGDVYLASISTRNNVAVSGVSGLGLSWRLAGAQCAGRAQTRTEVWVGTGSPSGSGAVTASFGGAPPAAVIAVSRYSGVEGANPIGGVAVQSTAGTACSGGTDSASYSTSLATTVSGSVVYGGVSLRLRSHSPGSGYTELAQTYGGSGGEAAGLAVQHRTVSSPSTVAFNGTLSGTSDWAVVAVELRPSGSGGTAPTATPPPSTSVPTATPVATNTPVLPTATPSSGGSPLAPGFYQETDSRITYVGAWLNWSSTGPNGGTTRYTNELNAYASFSFDGTGFTLYRLMSDTRGNMEVCIDGQCQTVNNYSATLQWNQPITFGGLASGIHSATIRNAETGKYLDVDAIEVFRSTTSPTSTPAGTCPSSVPPGVTAQGQTASSTDWRTVTLRWEDVNGPCVQVQHYTVYASYGSYAQQWTFTPTDARCDGSSCYGTITLPSTVSAVYWHVKATNALGEGANDNQKRYP